jgi:hypothetical protein
MEIWLLKVMFLVAVIEGSNAGAPPPSRTIYHKYRPSDLGPTPFVDEVTGQCILSPCDALGRARDELYSILDEKEKVQSQSRTLIGELQQAVGTGQDALNNLRITIQLMEQRIRSLEQSGLKDIHFY